MFENFDFSNFWLNDDNAPEPSDELISEIEKDIGYKLPESYIWLMKKHNGGMPRNYTIILDEDNKDEFHECIEITTLYAIDKNYDYGIAGEYGTKFIVDEWGYPDIGVAICDTPSAGHEMIFLDYRDCGNQGEPKVSYIDQECDYQIITIANNFEEFIRKLSPSPYDELEGE